MLLSLLLACRATVAPVAPVASDAESAADCLEIAVPALRDKCLSIFAVELFKTDPEHGIAVVEEQVTDPQVRDFIWLQVTREVDPGSLQYCARIQEEILAARCHTLVMRPHTYAMRASEAPLPDPGPGYAPARFTFLDPHCTDSCAPLLEDAPLAGVLEYTLTVDPPEQQPFIEGSLRRNLGKLRYVHSTARGRCPCLDGWITFRITIVDGEATVTTVDTNLSSRDSGLLRGRLSQDWWPATVSARATLQLTLTSQAQP